MSRPDIPTLVAGLGITGLGTMLLLDQLGTLDLGFAALAPIACAVIGGILLANGLSRRE